VIKTDVGFSIDALNGFPGAFGKYVFPQLGSNGILKLMQGEKNRCAFSTEVLAYATPQGIYKTFKTIKKLEILTQPKGKGSAMDQIMQIAGEHDKNYGSMSLNEKLEWWKNRDNYFHDFAKWFSKQP
jgi:XTP/dITP diphosphohydrolase